MTDFLTRSILSKFMLLRFFKITSSIHIHRAFTILLDRNVSKLIQELAMSFHEIESVSDFNGAYCVSM